MKILFYFDGQHIILAREDQEERIREMSGGHEPTEVLDFDEKPITFIKIKVDA